MKGDFEMKTAKEITEAIARKKKELTDWATKAIDEASETMFKDATTSARIRIDSSKRGDFEQALDSSAIKKVLLENGFEVSKQNWDYYLIFK